VTTDGRQFIGMLTDEVGHTITLVGLEGKRHTLLRSQLDTLHETGQSLMPEGFEKELSDSDLSDVIAYLARDATGQASITPGRDGSFRLPADRARIVGANVTYEPDHGSLANWTSNDDRAIWSLSLPAEGRYAVFVDCSASNADLRLDVDTNGDALSARLDRTGTADAFAQVLVGHLFMSAGAQQVALRVKGGQERLSPLLRNVWFVPVDVDNSNWRKGVADNTPRIELPSEDGQFELTGATGEIYGEGTLFDPQHSALAFWPGGENHASWTLVVKQTGQWLVFIDYACGRNPGRSSLTVSSGDSQLRGRIIGTGSWKQYRQRLAGTITLEAGYRRLNFRCAGQADDCLIDVRSITLVPAKP
jgi:hypothetical protein